MDLLVVIAALGLAGFAVVVTVAWWIDRLVKREADLLHQRAEDQQKTLATVSAELHFARRDVSRLQSEVSVMRHAMEYFLEGPPSIRNPSAGTRT